VLALAVLFSASNLIIGDVLQFFVDVCPRLIAKFLLPFFLLNTE